MSNKELAVQLYSAFLQATASVAANPNYRNNLCMPSLDEMVAQVAELTEKLSRVEDK